MYCIINGQFFVLLPDSFDPLLFWLASMIAQGYQSFYLCLPVIMPECAIPSAWMVCIILADKWPTAYEGVMRNSKAAA